MEVKEQIKILLVQRRLKLKDLAEKLTAETGKKYTPNSLTQRLGRGSLTYNEVTLIAKLLNFSIKFEDNSL